MATKRTDRPARLKRPSRAATQRPATRKSAAGAPSRSSRQSKATASKPNETRAGNRDEKVSRQRILDAFAEAWLEEGEPPESVAAFCRDLGISQAAFYRQFASFRAVEKAFWKAWIGQVVTAVSSGGEWSGFSARERYLAFLYAFIHFSLERRAIMADRFERLPPLLDPPPLEGFRSAFLEFARELVHHGHATGEIAERNALLKLYPSALYLHLRLVIGHHLGDESEEFQRTDAFIEKTVALAFDLFRSQALDSAIDLVRFLIPQTPWPWCRQDKE